MKIRQYVALEDLVTPKEYNKIVQHLLDVSSTETMTRLLNIEDIVDLGTQYTDEDGTIEQSYEPFVKALHNVHAKLDQLPEGTQVLVDY